MSDARGEILERVRRALHDVPADERPEDVAVPRAYHRAGHGEAAEVIRLFEDRVRDYHATVRRVTVQEVTGAIGDACRELGLRRIVIPPGLPAHWRPLEVELVEDLGLTGRELDAVDGVLTGCAVAIAQTGTLVLDGQDVSGRRPITLVPDNHICVVRADQVVDSVPEALAQVAAAVREQRRPVTLVSGPSASSDIELARVEGVHGPRNLLVLIVC